MTCVHPVNVDGRTFACGRCISCRVNRGQAWSARLLHELESWPDSRFVTLTYEDSPGTLIRRDLQTFHKRLRFDLKDRRIKYYSVGEYGERRGRPHYHGIYFGLSKGDFDLIESAWGKGRIHVGTVTSQSVNYVTAYITKKLWGEVGRDVYKGIEPPFSMMSKGIGLSWFESNQVRLLADLGLRKRGKVVPMPRYYWNKLRDDIPEELIDYLKLKRGQDLDASLVESGISATEFTMERIKQRDQVEADLLAKRGLHDAEKGIFLSRQ